MAEQTFEKDGNIGPLHRPVPAAQGLNKWSSYTALALSKLPMYRSMGVCGVLGAVTFIASGAALPF